MFSSNQVLEISGEFYQLQAALDFAIGYYEKEEKDLVFQITENGKYCIGWKPNDYPIEGWENFQFDFDTEIVSKIIIQFLKKQKFKDNHYDYFDGGTNEGFLLKAIPQTFSDEENGIKDPFYGIVSIEPFVNYYSK